MKKLLFIIFLGFSLSGYNQIILSGLKNNYFTALYYMKSPIYFITTAGVVVDTGATLSQLRALKKNGNTDGQLLRWNNYAHKWSLEPFLIVDTALNALYLTDNTVTASGGIALGFECNVFGVHGFAIGLNCMAGIASLASGVASYAKGVSSVSLNNSLSNGNYCFSSGMQTNSNSYDQFTIGYNNDTTGNTSYTSWVATDKLFVIGNGFYGGRHNAFEMQKNGNTILNGKLKVRDSVQSPLYLQKTDTLATKLYVRQHAGGGGGGSFNYVVADTTSDAIHKVAHTAYIAYAGKPCIVFVPSGSYTEIHCFNYPGVSYQAAGQVNITYTNDSSMFNSSAFGAGVDEYINGNFVIISNQSVLFDNNSTYKKSIYIDGMQTTCTGAGQSCIDFYNFKVNSIKIVNSSFLSTGGYGMKISTINPSTYDQKDIYIHADIKSTYTTAVYLYYIFQTSPKNSNFIIDGTISTTSGNPGLFADGVSDNVFIKSSILCKGGIAFSTGNNSGNGVSLTYDSYCEGDINIIEGYNFITWKGYVGNSVITINPALSSTSYAINDITFEAHARNSTYYITGTSLSHINIMGDIFCDNTVYPYNKSGIYVNNANAKVVFGKIVFTDYGGGSGIQIVAGDVHFTKMIELGNDNSYGGLTLSGGHTTISDLLTWNTQLGYGNGVMPLITISGNAVLELKPNAKLYHTNNDTAAHCIKAVGNCTIILNGCTLLTSNATAKPISNPASTVTLQEKTNWYDNYAITPSARFVHSINNAGQEITNVNFTY